MRPCIPVACLQTQSGWASEQGRGQQRECEKMPHVEQCDLVLFPSNIHKQEQTNMAGQSNCNFLFTVKLDFKDMLAFLFLNRMIQCLIIICLFTSITLLRLIRKKKKKKKKKGEEEISLLWSTQPIHARACAHTQAPYIHTGWVYELFCEGDQQASVSCCVFACTGLEKKLKPQRQTGWAKEPVCL